MTGGSSVKVTGTVAEQPSGFVTRAYTVALPEKNADGTEIMFRFASSVNQVTEFVPKLFVTILSTEVRSKTAIPS